ncbi:hypothetical protein N7454_010758 [Penicillium verhagenii]|nr:hypothetical protein N7454_010758 [Penicillium verhagenii]
MAALNLVQAVRFTAQGYKKLTEEELSLVFEILMNLIFKAQERTKEVQLFGQYIEDLTSIKKNIKFDYRSPGQRSTRSAAAIFSRFMTMLEYFTEFSVNKTGKSKQIAVFNACRDELSQSYQHAVEYAKVNDDALAFKPRMKSASEQISEIQNSKVMTTKICGQIARYIILAWTYYVGIVVWDSVEEKECRTKFLRNADESRIYSPYDIARKNTSSNGTARNDTASNGTASINNGGNGTASITARSNGTASITTRSNGTAGNGAASNGIMSNGSSIKDLPESFVLS